MCAEDEYEKDGLLGSGSPSKAPAKQHRVMARGWKQYISLFALIAAAFAAGYAFHGRSSSNIVGNVNILDNSGSVSSAIEDGLGTSDVPSPLFNASFTEYLISGMKNILEKNEFGTKKTYYVYDSPYNLRWPDNEKPTWAKKVIPYNKKTPLDKQICFVHVGKAGGSTVGCMLGFNLHCESHNDIIDLLPIVTTHAFHRGINDCLDDAKYYLFVVRDPLARMLSAFNYERPNATDPKAHRSQGPFSRGKLYDECNFQTLEDLAQNGLLNKHPNGVSDQCRTRANKAVTGLGNYIAHWYFNYQYYAQSVFGTKEDNYTSTAPNSNTNILVIRNEHIVEDWNKINVILDGHNGVLQSSQVPRNNPTAPKIPNEKYLSDDSKAALCEVLCNEIQIYKELISKAKNLNNNDMDQSINELQQICPKEAMNNTCLQERPDFRERIESTLGASANAASLMRSKVP
ncbi:hypothetical protein ACHAXA_005464 [Cyclostephanos tholiformis]|uniref:Uncharacterized protein n=1 Tax=Cyclostephanos tholiformis TaxID=382380 RepID=A0ABD3SHU7_9STRA